MQRKLFIWVPAIAVTATALPVAHATYYQRWSQSNDKGMAYSLLGMVLLFLVWALVSQAAAKYENNHLVASPVRPALHAVGQVALLVVALLACLVPHFEGLILCIVVFLMSSLSFQYWTYRGAFPESLSAQGLLGLLGNVQESWGLLMDWLALPLVWLFWRHRKNWLGKNVANAISLARLPLMIWILTDLVGATPGETFRLIFRVGLVQLLDGLDGPVSRGLGTSTPKGGAIDGSVDKVNTAMFIGVLIWRLTTNGAPLSAIICSSGFIIIVVLLQLIVAKENKRRAKLATDLHQQFRSRPPAQINFVASMLIVATCWLIPSYQVAGWALVTGTLIMVGMGIWVMDDYVSDRQQMEREAQHI